MITPLQRQRALRHPHERASMDILERMMGGTDEDALAAYAAIKRDAHRGWIDVLLAQRPDALHHSLRRMMLWQEALLQCLGSTDYPADWRARRSANAGAHRGASTPRNTA
jgi:hypothetical protein